MAYKPGKPTPNMPKDLLKAWQEWQDYQISLAAAQVGITPMPAKPPAPKLVVPKLETLHSTEELIGYRFWTVKKGRLGSLVHATEWPVRSPLERACKGQCKQPDKSRTGQDGYCDWPNDSWCGIYAYKSIDAVLRDISTSDWWSRNNPTLRCIVFGTVKLWGTVLECDHGYKAQYAEPQELYAVHDFDPLEIMEIEENHAPVSVIDPALRNKLNQALQESTNNRFNDFINGYTFTWDSKGNMVVI